MSRCRADEEGTNIDPLQRSDTHWAAEKVEMTLGKCFRSKSQSERRPESRVTSGSFTLRQEIAASASDFSPFSFLFFTESAPSPSVCEPRRESPKPGNTMRWRGKEREHRSLHRTTRERQPKDWSVSNISATKKTGDLCKTVLSCLRLNLCGTLAPKEAPRLFWPSDFSLRFPFTDYTPKKTPGRRGSFVHTAASCVPASDFYLCVNVQKKRNRQVVK